MGLDIIAHKCIVEATGSEAFDEEGELKWEEGWFQVYVNPDYPDRAKNISGGLAYKSKEKIGFRAGSYSGYSRWRNDLAKLAGYAENSYMKHGSECQSYDKTVWDDPKPGPFMELINFSDCEGVIDNEISSKLASDFAEFQSKANATDDEYFIQKYNDWRKAFELASDRGCVEFH